MIILDTDDFKDPKIALRECSCYIFSCFSKEEQAKIKQDWIKAGGFDNMSWWEWCIKHCNVSYDNNNKEQIMNNDKEEEDNVLE